ncbi:cupin domain-containing protein [Halobacillus sp. BBL2006]|uniref:cupin domain-containing protein n=1 Tax=Halobacillus sp. BBL2006 TaxID=1543706 RepID=UPI0005420FAC|nr:cupin domain-containing protein [Halobacillus sp. BBL2006]KHE71773.1 cupin [Halobacillus sp. BBL2006]
MSDTFVSFVFDDDGYFPNHPYLPAMIYRQFLKGTIDDYEKLLRENRWSNTWVGDIFYYHHYHSRTHETLSVLQGAATLILGGPNGKVVDVEQGDVLILPAGVAHKNQGATEDFQVMGAYPFGESFDLKTGEKHEYEQALKEIPKALFPKADPVLGENGTLMEVWNS